MIPEYGKNKFECPHCQTVATQSWFDSHNASSFATEILQHIYLDYRTGVQDYIQTEIANFLKTVSHTFKSNFSRRVPIGFSIATCGSCGKFSLWVNSDMKFPKASNVPSPNVDLNQDIKDLYYEAALILSDSPKGATALLRLSLQKLLQQVGKSGKNINGDIKELVSEGLSPKIQQALDLLRVIGNNAVHPGQINIDDNVDIAYKLFDILNFIAEELITKPKELDALYSGLVPIETQEHIKQRDKA